MWKHCVKNLTCASRSHHRSLVLFASLIWWHFQRGKLQSSEIMGEWVLSKFNGTSTPKGSYRAKTGDNDCNVNSSRYRLSTALCESIRYQAKSEQDVRQDLIPMSLWACAHPCHALLCQWWPGSVHNWVEQGKVWHAFLATRPSHIHQTRKGLNECCGVVHAPVPKHSHLPPLSPAELRCWNCPNHSSQQCLARTGSIHPEAAEDLAPGQNEEWYLGCLHADHYKWPQDRFTWGAADDQQSYHHLARGKEKEEAPQNSPQHPSQSVPLHS